MELEGKTAVVTGASRGAGEAFTSALVKNKCKVFGLARSYEQLEKLQQKLGDLFVPVPMDITAHEKLKAWVKTTFSANHFPDILVNNAGTSRLEEVDQLSDTDWQMMIQTNLSAVHYLTSAIVPWMKQTETSSHIINIGSILGKVSGTKKSAYSATKFAIQGYSEALFKELRAYNIKVTCLNPGSIQTDFFEESGISANEKMLQPNELADILIYLLKTPKNVLIDELTVRPLRPR